MLWPSHAHVHAWIGDLLCQCSSNSRFLFIGGGSSILRHTTRLTDYRPLSSVAPPSFAPLPHSHHPTTNSSPFYFSTFLKHPPHFFNLYPNVVIFWGLFSETDTFGLTTHVQIHSTSFSFATAHIFTSRLSLECILLVVRHIQRTTQQ